MQPVASRKSLRAGLVLAALFVGIILLTYRDFFASRLEAFTFSMHPSAERAYELGMRHFNAQDSAEYNIQKAEYFLDKAAALNPTYPYVQHQLGRIAFLRGNFASALARTDLELATNHNPSPSSFYMRGLIEGYMGKYDDAARDYEKYLESDPNNWAALNDYAWVLLKASRFTEALQALDRGLRYFPENPWLLNSRAIALQELGRGEEARLSAEAAQRAVEKVTERDWLIAYPGNDPSIAQSGVAAFKQAILSNLHTLELANASNTVQ